MSIDVEDLEDAVLNVAMRHWTTHSLTRFFERYGDFAIAPHDFMNFIPRIDFRCRDLIARSIGRSRAESLALVSILTWSEAMQKIIKVRLLYNYRDKVIVTAFPEKLEPKPRRVVHLVV